MLARRLAAASLKACRSKQSLNASFVLQRQLNLSSCLRASEDADANKATKTPPSKIRVYTRTGDKGQSSLFTGERRPKNDAVFDALGNADELNSALGLAIEYCADLREKNKSLEAACSELEAKLASIQSILLDIGSFIATPKTKAGEKQLARLAAFDATLTAKLEKWIDQMDTELPPLRNFILPSGGKFASCLHISRGVCRRLERSMQPLLQSKDLDAQVAVFVNRLSDFLFVCARYAAMKEGRAETVYKKQ